VNLRAQVFEDRVELDIEVLEAVPLSSKSPQSDLNSFPYPALRRTGKGQKTLFRTLILENAYLRLTIVPDLGGRILSLFDKRTQKELLSQEMTFLAGGVRGVGLDQGIRFELTPERTNSLGPVDFVADEDEDGSATVTLGEIHGDLSWHLILTMPPDSATVGIEGRVFNRSWHSVAYNAEFRYADAGIHFHCEPGGWIVSSAGAVQRFELARHLMPQQLDVWGVMLIPAEGAVDAVCPDGALSVGERFAFQATRPFKGEIFVLLDSGQTLEAPVEIDPAAAFGADLPGRVVGVSIRDEEGRTVLHWPASDISLPVPDERGVDLEFLSAAVEAESASETELAHHAFDLRTRHAAHMLMAVSYIRAGNWAQAQRSLDDALSYGAENHLVWLIKAILARKEGSETDDLLNGHFLAPLEPLFRMESFLSQNVQTREPSPLIAPLADNPGALIEGAAFLFHLGLYDDLSRWVDECLRHREVPMLRYFLAEALLARSPMSVDAASHVQRAAQTPINPPYPGRPVEITVLRRLSERFPDEARIKDLLDLWASRSKPGATG